MTTSPSIFVRAQFEVLDGRQATFEDIALALQKQASEEPGTRTYRWFAAGPGRFLVLEEYVDESAALRHNETAVDLLAQVGETARLVSAEVYGPIGPALDEWVRSHPQVTAYADFPAGDGDH